MAKKKQAVNPQQPETVEVQKKDYMMLREAYGENILLRQRMSLMEQEIRSLETDVDTLSQERDQLKIALAAKTAPWWRRIINQFC